MRVEVVFFLRIGYNMENKSLVNSFRGLDRLRKENRLPFACKKSYNRFTG